MTALLVIMRFRSCMCYKVGAVVGTSHLEHEPTLLTHNSSLLSPVSFCSLSYAASTFSFGSSFT